MPSVPKMKSGLLLKSVGLLKTILLRFWTTCYLIIDKSPHLLDIPFPYGYNNPYSVSILYLSQVAEIVQISVKDKQQSLFFNKFEPLKRTPTLRST